MPISEIQIAIDDKDSGNTSYVEDFGDIVSIRVSATDDSGNPVKSWLSPIGRVKFLSTYHR